MVWRSLEEDQAASRLAILTFYNYTKAFDSLQWSHVWQALPFAGCPPPLIAVIRNWYALSTIAVRLNPDGRCVNEFYQRRGISQGSGLLPLIFVLTLDFVMRVFQDACELEGLPSRLLSWNAYADDITDKCNDEITATAQLEAAGAFVSLQLTLEKQSRWAVQ